MTSGYEQGLAEGVSPADLQSVLQALAHALFAPHTAPATRQTADECLKVRRDRAADSSISS